MTVFIAGSWDAEHGISTERVQKEKAVTGWQASRSGLGDFSAGYAKK